VRSCAVSFASIVLLLLSTSAARADGTSVTTLAGSGLAGLTDGPAAQARFLEPNGVAVARNGDVYVADSAAQRIRLISHGAVTTVAGSGSLAPGANEVAGGYRDGPANEAQFDRPSGIAIASDGTVYVADAGNGCIRAIRGGIVSTYARDFTSPRSLAFGPDGALYVADFGAGLRRVAADGSVTTIVLPPALGLEIWSVAFWFKPGDDQLFVAGPGGLLVRYLARNDYTLIHTPGTFDPPADHSIEPIEGFRSMGFAYGLAPTSDGSTAFTDPRFHTIRYFSERYGIAFSDALPERSPLEASLNGGGYADGDAGVAQFDAPLGIGRLNDRSLVVADSGNRRIREVTDVDERRQIDVLESNDLSRYSAPATDYRLALVGMSFVQYGFFQHDAPAGIIEGRLRRDAARIGLTKPPYAYAVKVEGSLADTAGYIRTVLADGLVDDVVLQLNAEHINMEFKKPLRTPLNSYSATWQPAISAELAALARDLKAKGVGFAVAPLPWGYELSPLEMQWYRYAAGTYIDTNDYSADIPLIEEAIARAGVHRIDTFEAFQNAESAARRRPLYETAGWHLSAYGNALYAATVEADLEASRPWMKAVP
jgi:NHL repeat